MRNGNGSAVKETVSNNFLNEAIRSILYGGRRLVYYNKIVFLKKRTCKGDELALTWTQRSSAVREVLVQLLEDSRPRTSIDISRGLSRSPSRYG